MGGKNSGLKPFTHKELLAAHRKQDIRLMNVSSERKKWKERAWAAEAKTKEIQQSISHYAFIDKKPDYFFSFSGHLIFRRFYALNGLTAMQVELLVIISYTKVFLTANFKIYNRNYLRRPIVKTLDSLIKQGYITKVQVPGKNRLALRNGYILTQRGKDLEADYERFYDEKIAELKSGKLTRFSFEDGAYFRRVYLTRHDRRILQGGGMLPTGQAKENTFIDQEVYNKLYEKK